MHAKVLSSLFSILFGQSAASVHAHSKTYDSLLTRHSCLKHLCRFLHMAGCAPGDFNTQFSNWCCYISSSLWPASTPNHNTGEMEEQSLPQIHSFTCITQPKWQLSDLLPHQANSKEVFCYIVYHCCILLTAESLYNTLIYPKNCILC